MASKSTILADKLYQLRASRRIQQKTLASAIGVEPPQYSRMEKGQRSIRLDQLEIIAKILQADLNELHSLWLADKVVDAASGLPKEVAENAISIVNDELSNQEK